MASADRLEDLAQIVLNNLENQQDWTRLQIHHGPSHPRPLISGLSPRRLYTHPDEQIEILKAERHLGGARLPQPPEFEWVLPVHLAEKPTIGQFAAVFDSIDALPPDALSEDDTAAEAGDDAAARWKQWRGSKRQKRIVLAVVQDDSTVSYYVMHDGIVKPRQN